MELLFGCLTDLDSSLCYSSGLNKILFRFICCETPGVETANRNYDCFYNNDLIWKRMLIGSFFISHSERGISCTFGRN